MAATSKATTLHGILDEAVGLCPEQVCLQMGQYDSLTYEQVKQASVRCAGHVAALGEAAATLLVCAERSYGMVVCMLGAMRAGSAYCPVEPDYPESRLRSMLEVADMRFCLTPDSQAPQALVAHFPEIATLAVQDDGRAAFVGSSAAAETHQIPQSVPDSTTAYVLFTSGSTGKPKGCMVPHRGSALYAHAVVDACELERSMTFLLKTPYVFDVSIQDIYTAFSAGGKLAIAEPGLHKDAAALGALIARSGVNCLAFTPTLLVEFVNYLALNADVAEAVGRSLRRVLTIGEALMAATCRQLFALIPQLDGQLHNLYGPTEASVGVSHFQVSTTTMGEGAVVPIGRPFGYVEFKVFDPSRYDGKTISPDLLVEVPPGETGELFIGGDCLAQGYMQDPARTGAAFFNFPQILARPADAASQFSLYKTGDLVRCGPNGLWEIFGRTDFQVKIGGVRIECEEISAVLKEHPLVDDALVVAFDGPFGKALAAYVVGQQGMDWLVASPEGGCGSSPKDFGGEFDGVDCMSSDSSSSTPMGESTRAAAGIVLEELRSAACNQALSAWVKQTSLLPVMRPTVYILLSAFPKNTAGKVDRGVLPCARKAFNELVSSHSEELVLPASEDERLMAECWERVLGMQISMEAPFSTYGGHSLTALALRSEISKQFGSFPALTAIMAEDGTPRKLLENIRSHVVTEETGEVQFPFVVGRTISTLFHFDNMDPSLYLASHKAVRAVPSAKTKALMYSEFVPSVKVELQNPVADMEGLVASLLEAHPILHARYSRQRQLVIPSRVAEAREYWSLNGNLDDIRHAVMKMYDCPLFHLVGHGQTEDATCGPVTRITVVWNHIISDAYSGSIIRRDIEALARGEVLQPANLRAYVALAEDTLAKPVVNEHAFKPFSLPRRRSYGIRALRGKVVHTMRVMVAVSYHDFSSDMDRARFFLDAFCASTGQSQGTFGLVTNARARADVDASNLVGALIYNSEYSYNSATGEITSLGVARDARSGVAFNLHDSFAGMSVEEALPKLGVKHADKVAQGNTDYSITRSFTGAFGANFADGQGLLVECLPVAGATVFRGLYPDTVLNAKSIVRDLHQRLCSSH